MSSTITQSQVLDVAVTVRDFLELAWRDWRADRGIPQPEINSYSMCRMSSAFLAKRLTDELGGEWHVLGGAGEEGWDLGDCLLGAEPGGVLSTDGVWSGHWWVKGHGIIVDVTADQFGLDPVIATSDDDQRYARNYTARAMRKYLSRVTKTVEGWTGRWRAPPATGLRL